ncbi:hypothetical protein BB559_005634 [Furculomyces boomerangus]|uniref:AMP-dependent synthetase/ligase domain-containing protein n=2 Tax=Harpellales TaxID=61421 RepID=A0A2T9Y7H3_9FUNG|nr:hypothetical protein BB559_005634 [Furculomyces boomerangus]PVZ97833.1 hypothetical protein BB558_006199 [Smittium angustum]
MIFKSLLPDENIPNVDLATYIFEKGKQQAQKSNKNSAYAIYDEETGQKYTIDQLEQESARFASGLVNKLGFQTDSTLMIFSTNSANFVVTLLGTLMVGGILTFANPVYTPAELTHQIKDSKPTYIATKRESLPVALKALQLSGANIPMSHFIILDHNANDIHDSTTPIAKLFDNRPFTRFAFGGKFPDSDGKTAFLPYSSGTTGLGKGVILSHKNIVANIIQIDVLDKYNDWHTDRSFTHRYIGVLPWYHIYGLVTCLCFGLSNDVGIVSVTKFEMEKFLSIVQEEKITLAHLVPPILINLTNSPLVSQYDITSIKVVTTAAAPIGKELMETLGKKFPFFRMTKLYGVTESSPIISAAPNWNTNIESSGILSCNIESKVIDDDGNELGVNGIGELLFRGPNMMKGYLNNKQATEDTLDKDEFLHTGDIGYYDETGNLYVVDRKKELIKYKGYQVPPAELEALLLGNEDVADCAVIGIYVDEQATEVPKAFITLKTHHLNKSDSEKLKIANRVKLWVQERVAPYKRLRGGVEILDIIPKSNAGKILRRLLRDMEKAKKSLDGQKPKL